MGMIVKTIVAFCIGLAALTAAQRLWMSSIMAQVRSETARPSVAFQSKPFVPTLDTRKLSESLMPAQAPIDTKRFEALGVEGAQRRIDMQIRNAQSAVPVQRSFPGMPRR
jgi:hypothetical protein